ncbi:hypothetical protein RRG08_027755 [Elysia crispata]|uniref:Uncharacterized protein n=1 Tax=Elysia crispata TaxID=231223 RepID=A0AAE0Z980_9GAST|nr:hypothetical protein RRG08_027755 [Elysia crispata]
MRERNVLSGAELFLRLCLTCPSCPGQEMTMFHCQGAALALTGKCGFVLASHLMLLPAWARVPSGQQHHTQSRLREGNALSDANSPTLKLGLELLVRSALSQLKWVRKNASDPFGRESSLTKTVVVVWWAGVGWSRDSGVDSGA